MIIRTKDFQIPQKLSVEKDTLTHMYGKFFAEPFERGFGSTIGNSLRRVLLSSIVGAAVTSLKIDGVLHEFSTIPGVKEDVTDIILNVKALRLKLHTEKPKTIYLQKKGPGEVRAADITPDADIEVLNPDLHIANLGRDAKLYIEMVANLGRGYVPAERNKEDGQAIGVIPVDSIFSPIKKVNFNIENTRVGRQTDYEKLILEVWTDGGIKPDDAIAHAAKILKDHLSIFINFEEDERKSEEPEGEEQKKKVYKDIFRNINELELSVRAANCLKNANITTIADLVQKTEAEMLKTKNFGRKSLNEIKGIINNMGLRFGMKLEDIPKEIPRVELQEEEI